jgi:hypothetical protein
MNFLSRLLVVYSPAPGGFNPLTYSGQRPLERLGSDLRILTNTVAASVVVGGGLVGFSALLIQVLGLVAGGFAASGLVISVALGGVWWYAKIAQYYDQELSARLDLIRQRVEVVRGSQGNNGCQEVQDAIDAFLDALNRFGGPDQFIDPDELVRRDAGTYLGDNVRDLMRYRGQLAAACLTPVQVLTLAQQLAPILDLLPKAKLEDGDEPSFGKAVAKHRYFYWPRVMPVVELLAVMAGVFLIYLGFVVAAG